MPSCSPSYDRWLRQYRARAYHPRFRYGRGQRIEPWQKAALALCALLAFAGGTGAASAVIHHGHHPRPAPATVTDAAPPASIAYSRMAWARALLRAIPEPRTACDIAAVTTWETREGGGFGNQAAYNPLNLNPGAGAAWPGYPAIGAWAFPSARIGLAYTVTTVRAYPGILAALHAGGSAQAVCDAVMASPWAASHYDGTLYCAC